MRHTIPLVLVLLLATGVTAPAGTNIWSGSGPFATGLGNRSITALAVSADGATVYAGSGSGTVFSYSYAVATLVTVPADNITISGAIFNGTVNANENTATVAFEYGLTTAYGSNVYAAPLSVTGSQSTPVSAAVNDLTCGTLYHFRVSAANAGGISHGSDATFTTDSCPDYLVSVSVTGSGSVHGSALSHIAGNPTDIACSGTGSGCTVLYPTGETINLTVTPGAMSIFSGWGLDCLGQGNPCTLSLNAAKSVSATFTPAPLAKNSTTGISYATLTEALAAANTVTPDTVLLLGAGHDGAVTLGRGVILSGGWDTFYQALSGMTTALNNGLAVSGGDSRLESVDIKGKLTITGGSLKVRNVTLK